MDQLVRPSDSGGFTAKKLADAIDMVEKMVRDDENCLTFLSFPACIMATGTRGVIELVKRKLVDVVITTCGTLDHDLARSWKDYYHGDFSMDDAEPRAGRTAWAMCWSPTSYGLVLEETHPDVRGDLAGRDSSHIHPEIIDEVGARLDDEESLLYWAHRNGIPIFGSGNYRRIR